MGVRAGIIVTGTEVLTGRVFDRNGPWLAEQLRQLGVDVGQTVVVGDRPEDLRSALQFLTGHNELVITSGGLGPTADDLTAEVVGQFQGRPSALDLELEQRITAIVKDLTARLGGNRDQEATAIATRKQALVPAGATVLEPTGTAPGLVVPVASGRTGPPVIVLPGPPRELQQMWPDAVAAPVVATVLADVPELRQRTVRLWGVPESELAATLRRVDADLAGLEITTCLRSGELEIVSRYSPAAEPSQQHLVDAVRADFPQQLFSADGATVDDLVGKLLIDRQLSVGVIESATGGVISSRLASVLGASAYVVGGLVLAAAEGLTEVAKIPAEVIADYEPMSPQVAHALADQARTTFSADVGIGAISGHLCVLTPDAERTRSLTSLPAQTQQVLIPPAVLHLLRQALAN
jgi:nicotinamide-nucleotide amidase